MNGYTALVVFLGWLLVVSHPLNAWKIWRAER